MNNRHAAHVQRMVDAVLSRPGDTDPTLRHAIEAWSAKLGGRSSTEVVEIPAELTGYVNKVALHAYKTLDEDIETLRNAGYSEDAIFEITLTGSHATSRSCASGCRIPVPCTRNMRRRPSGKYSGS